MNDVTSWNVPMDDPLGETYAMAIDQLLDSLSCGCAGSNHPQEVHKVPRGEPANRGDFDRRSPCSAAPGPP